MRLPTLLLALLLLTACAQPMREEAVAEPEVVAEAPAALGSTTDCQSGDDDGIGGTGCRVD